MTIAVTGGSGKLGRTVVRVLCERGRGKPSAGGEPQPSRPTGAAGFERQTGVMGFTRAQLEAFRGRDVPEFVPEHPRLVFVGINPGLWTAATGVPFARPGNRFYPALVKAGIIPRAPVITEEGMLPADADMIFGAGIGISSMVHRATARADELARAELVAGAERLVEDAARWGSRVVAVAGLTAFRQGFARPKAVAGRQPDDLSGSELWVVPNPSGLNAHDTVDTLAEAYAAPARAAGVIP